MQGSFSIGAERTRLLLAKVVPGAEQMVLGEIRSRFAKKAPTEQWRALLAFGQYDIIVQMKGELLPKVLLETGTIPFVLGIRLVDCFEIRVPGAHEFSLNPFPIVWFTFLRPPCYFTSIRHSTRVERSLCDWWCTKGGHPDSWNEGELFFGSLGQSEFVNVRGGSSITEAYRWLEQIHPIEWQLEKTLTVIAVDLEMAKDYSPPDSITEPEESLLCHFLVSCRPQHRELLREYATKVLAQTEQGTSIEWTSTFLPGVMDFGFVVSFGHEIPWPAVVQRILDFRVASSDILLATTTTFLYRPASSFVGQSYISPSSSADDFPTRFEQAIQTFQESLSAPPRYTINDTEALQLSQLGALGELALQTMYVFGDLLQEEAVTVELLDMLGYFISYLDYALNCNQSPGQHVRDALAHRWLSAHHGLTQRLVSVHGGVNPIGGNLQQPLGGLNRVLQAAEAIPLSIFKYAYSELWPGFIVVGPPQQYMGGSDHVLNLASDCILSPNTWTWLLHESVHSLLLRQDAKLGFPLQRHTGECLASLDRMHHTTRHLVDVNTLTEIFVDVLQATFGVYWDPHWVVQDAWHNFHTIEALSQIDDKYAYQFTMRTAMVWACGELNFFSRLENESYLLNDQDRQHFNKLLKNPEPFWRAHSRYAPSLRESVANVLDHIAWNELTLLLEACWPLLVCAFSAAPVFGALLRTRREWFEKLENDTEGILSHITRGQVLFGEGVDFPELLVCALRRKYSDPNDMEFPQRTSAIILLMESFRSMMAWFRDTSPPASVQSLSN